MNITLLQKVDNPNETSPAEVRELSEGKLVVMHRVADSARLEMQEFTSYSNGWWSNDTWRCKFDSIEDQTKTEKLVRIKKPGK